MLAVKRVSKKAKYKEAFKPTSTITYSGGIDVFVN